MVHNFQFLQHSSMTANLPGINKAISIRRFSAYKLACLYHFYLRISHPHTGFLALTLILPETDIV